MQEYSIMYFLRLAWKRLWVLVLSFVIFSIGAFSYCKIIATPMYSAKSSVLLTNGAIVTQDSTSSYNSDRVNSADISASVNLTYTVVEILKTPDIYKKLAEKTDGKYSYGTLMSMATVEKRDDYSIFIDISFKSTNGNEAVTLANDFAEIACDYLPEYIPNAILKISSPSFNYSKVYPRTLSTVFIAGVIGAAISFGLVFIIDASNKAIRGEEEFLEKYDIPLLGSIPDFENAVSSDSHYGYYGKGGY